MNTRFSLSSRSARWLSHRLALVLSMMLTAASASASHGPLDIVLQPCTNPDTTYGSKAGEAPLAGDVITVVPNLFTGGGTVKWSLASGSSSKPCSVTGNVAQCAGITITAPTGSVAMAETVKLTGNASMTEGATGILNVTVTSDVDPTVTCKAVVEFHTKGNGGGWGDPHLTTINGTHFDFQSAGEFTALKEDTLEIQTRQTAVSTATPGGVNEYTGLGGCVSIYTAIAFRIGSNKVSLQPNINGEPDRSGMQLRVNGRLVTLGDQPIDLLAGAGTGPRKEGRIARVADGAIEISDARGTQIIVTPQFWDSQQKWYLNLAVNGTTATMGVIGRLADGSWLPALPDGSSLGPRPETAQQRYQDLYERFADAWRVTDSTSLFEYAPGTNTASFTVDAWPQMNPRSCLIQGQTPAQPVEPGVAQEACAAVTDSIRNADCVFDVRLTGNTNFAASYVALQQVPVREGGWFTLEPPAAPGGGTGTGTPPISWWWWLLLILIILIMLAIVARLRRA